MVSAGKCSISNYEKQYFTEHPYNPYQDFERHGKVFNNLVRILHPSSMLDVGCAYGFIVKRCLEAGIFAMGLDVSQWCGQQKVIPGHYIRGTAWALPFKNKSFHVLFSEGVLEHIPEDKIDQVFAEFERVAARRCLGVSCNSPQTEHHLTNHNIDWWRERIPALTWLGATSRSLDLEDEWVVKS